MSNLIAFCLQQGHVGSKTLHQQNLYNGHKMVVVVMLFCNIYSIYNLQMKYKNR